MNPAPSNEDFLFFHLCLRLLFSFISLFPCFIHSFSSTFSNVNPSCLSLPSHSCPPSYPFRLLSPLPHLFKVFPVCAVIALRITLRSNQQHLTKRCSLTVESSLKQPSYFPTTRHTNCNYTLTAVGTYIYVPVASRRGQRQLNSFQLKIRNTCVRSVIRSKCIRAAGNSRSVRLLLV